MLRIKQYDHYLTKPFVYTYIIVEVMIRLMMKTRIVKVSFSNFIVNIRVKKCLGSFPQTRWNFIAELKYFEKVYIYIYISQIPCNLVSENQILTYICIWGLYIGLRIKKCTYNVLEIGKVFLVFASLLCNVITWCNLRLISWHLCDVCTDSMWYTNFHKMQIRPNQKFFRMRFSMIHRCE